MNGLEKFPTKLILNTVDLHSRMSSSANYSSDFFLRNLVNGSLVGVRTVCHTLDP